MGHSVNSLKVSLNSYVNSYLQDIKSGVRCTESGNRYSVGSIYIINRTVSLFKELEKNVTGNLDWKDINMQFFYKFVQYMRLPKRPFRTA